MSHSQFHSINLFILRHAWLNLWDKHMTTGRINQVTTFPDLLISKWAPNTRQAQKDHLSWWEFVSDLNISNPSWESFALGYVDFSTTDWNHLVPRSHIIQVHCFLFCVTNKNYDLLRELPATSKTISCSPSHGGFPSVLIATSLAIGK